jgi:hypothetical protein
MILAVQQIQSVTDTIVEFLHESCNCFDAWSEGRLENYVNFFLRCEAAAVVKIEDDIVGVGIARPIYRDQVHLAKTHRFHFDESGDTLYADLLVATDPRAVPALYDLMIQRYGTRTYFAASRHGKQRVWPFNQFLNIVSVLKNR